MMSNEKDLENIEEYITDYEKEYQIALPRRYGVVT